jgi:hypothetical protein
MGTDRSYRTSRIILAAALSLTAVASAKAFEVTAEERAACTPDALRLCSSEIPDVGRIVACMKAKEASLSSQCRAVFQTAGLTHPSHQRIAHRAASTYASNEAAPTSSLSHRYSHQAFRLAASHGHRMHRMGSTYASYRELSPFAGGRWRHVRDDREALIIGRKVMMGFAMACQNHSIPAELCDLSANSAASSENYHESFISGPDFLGSSDTMPSLETSASEVSHERGSSAGSTKNIELGSFFGSFGAH